MSYVSGYRTRGMASLGDAGAVGEMASGLWVVVRFKHRDPKPTYWYTGPYTAQAQADRALMLKKNEIKRTQGSQYFTVKLEQGTHPRTVKVVTSGARVGTPEVDNSKLLQLGPRGVTRGGGSGATASISRGDDRDDSSSGGGGGGGGTPPSAPSSAAPQEVETENVAVTDEGPVPATSSGRPVSTAPAPLQTSTMLLIGGGLLAAYLLFGRKSR